MVIITLNYNYSESQLSMFKGYYKDNLRKILEMLSLSTVSKLRVDYIINGAKKETQIYKLSGRKDVKVDTMYNYIKRYYKSFFLNPNDEFEIIIFWDGDLRFHAN